MIAEIGVNVGLSATTRSLESFRRSPRVAFELDPRRRDLRQGSFSGRPLHPGRQTDVAVRMDTVPDFAATNARAVRSRLRGRRHD